MLSESLIKELYLLINNNQMSKNSFEKAFFIWKQAAMWIINLLKY